MFRRGDDAQPAVGFCPELAPLLLTVGLAATRPRTDEKGMRLVEVLPEALDRSLPIARNLPLDMTSRERATAQSCFANALVTAASFRNDPDLYQMAAQTYQEAWPTCPWKTRPRNGRSTRRTWAWCC